MNKDYYYYRAIALSTIFSKHFDWVILIKK